MHTQLFDRVARSFWPSIYLSSANKVTGYLKFCRFFGIMCWAPKPVNRVVFFFNSQSFVPGQGKDGEHLSPSPQGQETLHQLLQVWIET